MSELKSFSNRFPRIAFVAKGLAAAELLMFLCMAAGEIFVDPNLFSGFLKKPSIWIGILIETAVATLPVCVIGLLILNFIRPQKRNTYFVYSAGVWLLLGSIVVALYKIFYWTREWHLTLLERGLIFGWVIPCTLILCVFIWFSGSLYLKNGSIKVFKEMEG